MRRFTIAAVVMAAALCGAPTSEAHVVAIGKTAQSASSTPPCQTIYTVSDYRSYAIRVYRRERVSVKAHRLLADMHVCQRSYRARVAVGRHHDRYKSAREQRARAAACSNSNPVACIRLAAAHHGVSFSWLLACAQSEGGVGPSDYDKPNTQGSGATGNFQFMSGTFWGYVGRSGAPKPHVYLSSEDQAYTAAYMFKVGESGQWTGAGC